jgi:hypothetical protein
VSVPTTNGFDWGLCSPRLLVFLNLRERCHARLGEHGGFPRYGNEGGTHLWYHVPGDAWLLWHAFTPDSELCLGGIKAKPAPDGVPLSRTGMEWNCVVDGKREKLVLATVGLDQRGLDQEMKMASSRAASRRAARGGGGGGGERGGGRRGGGARKPARPNRVPPRAGGLSPATRQRVHQEATARAEAVLLALRPCMAKFAYAKNWSATRPMPWPKPDSAWAGGAPEGEMCAARFFTACEVT